MPLWCLYNFLDVILTYIQRSGFTFYLTIQGTANKYVVSRKSRSAINKNRIVKLYFVIDEWSVVRSCDLDYVKAKQETPSPILKERTRGGKTVPALLAYLYGF